jgi:hypothetical protein
MCVGIVHSDEFHKRALNFVALVFGKRLETGTNETANAKVNR